MHDDIVADMDADTRANPDKYPTLAKAMGCDEYPPCPKCGEPIDYCQGHGEIAEQIDA